MQGYEIRRVREDDRSAIAGIFNYFVESSFAAYPDKKVGPEIFDLLKNMSRGGVFYVAETADKEVIGFALLRHHQVAEAFKRSGEITYFILPEHERRGLGTSFMETILANARAAGVETLLANISSLNEVSLNFHLKHG
ncbi:MAG: GNAT family N-acetyltransferase, partial [Dehalococcoidia bacterium]